jgi:hypothetical protein
MAQSFSRRSAFAWKKPPKVEAQMLTCGWLAVLLGLLAVQWADGRFPFSNSL